jgi:signal transduction histidine kinase
MSDPGKVKILVVDDLSDKLLVYQSILQELDEEIIAVHSGAEALKQVLQHDFAVILLDVNMPDMDGFETAALIRQRKKSAHTPIIFVTAYADDMLLAKGYSHGAVDYILAPVVPDILRTKVKVFVQLFRMHRQTQRLAEERVLLAEEQAKRAAAEDANRRKDEFLAMLAHELRNPLAPIRNAVHILRQTSPYQRDLDWARDVIDRQVEHLTHLVDDLLDVSRITRGKIRLRRQPTDVATVVASALETSRPTIEGRKHHLVVSVPAEAVSVNADRARLAQILSNLLNNAAKYTAEGGHIWLTVRQEGAEVVFRVRDTGMGIPPEMLSTIFDLFTQADRSLDRSEGGLGIGLTLVRRLVELHEGTVQALSAGPGQGSEFVVRLPVLSETPRPSRLTRSTRPLTSPGTCQRILVVDDNVDAAESLAMLIRLHGHETRLAHDGAAALGVRQSFHPDVVLLDLGLPGMDGLEVARRMRQEANGDRLFLVAITGYGQEEDRRLSREAGFDLHLVKPIDPQELLSLLAWAPAYAGKQSLPSAVT